MCLQGGAGSLTVRVVVFRKVSAGSLTVGVVVFRKASAWRLSVGVVFRKVSAGRLYVGAVVFIELSAEKVINAVMVYRTVSELTAQLVHNKSKLFQATCDINTQLWRSRLG